MFRTRSLELEALEARTLLSFLPAEFYSVGASPRSVTTADFNGDGALDLAVPNINSNDLTVLLGDGAGAFAGAGTYAVGEGPHFAAVADFNGDRALDLLVSNSFDSTFSFLAGNGDGSFQPAVSFPSPGEFPHRLLLTDLNGDSHVDLLVLYSLSDAVGLLLSNGDGSFVDGGRVGVGLFPTGLTLGDFNGDGVADLAIANLLESTVTVLFGGKGGFGDPVTYAGLPNSWSVVACDFTGDDLLDLAVSTVEGVAVLPGRGDGTFGKPLVHPAGLDPVEVTTADVNGDRLPDLLVANAAGNSGSVLLGNGDGSFRPAESYAVGVEPYYIAVGDYNSDGFPDLAVSHYGADTMSILLNAGDWTGPGDQPSPGMGWQSALTGDRSSPSPGPAPPAAHGWLAAHQNLSQAVAIGLPGGRQSGKQATLELRLDRGSKRAHREVRHRGDVVLPLLVEGPGESAVLSSFGAPPGKGSYNTAQPNHLEHHP